MSVLMWDCIAFSYSVPHFTLAQNTWKYIWPLCRKWQSSYSLNCLLYFQFLVCYETFTLLPSIVDVSLCPSKNTNFDGICSPQKGVAEKCLYSFMCVFVDADYITGQYLKQVIATQGSLNLLLLIIYACNNILIYSIRSYSTFSTEINPDTHQEGQVKRRNICKSHKFHHNTMKNNYINSGYNYENERGGQSERKRESRMITVKRAKRSRKECQTQQNE